MNTFQYEQMINYDSLLVCILCLGAVNKSCLTDFVLSALSNHAFTPSPNPTCSEQNIKLDEITKN